MRRASRLPTLTRSPPTSTLPTEYSRLHDLCTAARPRTLGNREVGSSPLGRRSCTWRNQGHDHSRAENGWTAGRSRHQRRRAVDRPRTEDGQLQGYAITRRDQGHDRPDATHGYTWQGEQAYRQYWRYYSLATDSYSQDIEAADSQQGHVP